MLDHRSAASRPDWSVFGITLGVLLVTCTLLFSFPQAADRVIHGLYAQLTDALGIVYLWAALLVLGFCIWIAFSRYGSIRFGDVTPRFSLFSWTSMLFCAGVATGILYWGTIEWSFYYDQPPFGATARSEEAVRWASAFGMFHWGPTGWAFYCVPALAIGHAHHCRQIPQLRVSTACHGILGESTQRVAGRLCDTCFMLGLLGAAGTSLGFGTPMIAAGVSHIFGVEESYALTVGVAFACTLIFATSVYLGLEKGIQRLSSVNVGLTLLFLGFVLVVGPTREILSTTASGVFTVCRHFLKMHALAGPFDPSHYPFARNWTVFYWAWWIAVGPFMGVFIAQISRGRTFRQVVIGTITLGSLGCAVFYGILGNYALHLQRLGSLDVVAIKDNAGAPAAIIAVIASLPFAPVVVPSFCVIGLVFLATTYDSASYALAASATSSIRSDQAPARSHRLFWAMMLAMLPTALLVGDSGADRLRALQTASLIVSLPLGIVFGMMMWSLLKTLREDEVQRVAMSLHHGTDSRDDAS